MKSTIFYSLLFFIISINLEAQKGYYVKDTVKFSGVKISLGTSKENATKCIIMAGTEKKEYSPSEISEYGINKGKSYVSRVISINNKEKKVFLERLAYGDISIYYHIDEFGKKYFYEVQGGTLIELRKNKKSSSDYYRNVLNELTQNCEYTSKAIKQAKFNKNDLGQVIENYNTCENSYISSDKLGVSMGLDVLKMIPPKEDEYLGELLKKPSIGVSYGVFWEQPSRNQKLHVFTGLIFATHKYSEKMVFSSESSIQFTMNITSAQLPFLLRYYVNTNGKSNFYINGGAVLSYNLKHDVNYQQATETNDLPAIIPLDYNPIMVRTNVGLTIGLGYKFNLNGGKSLFIDLKNSTLYGLEVHKTIRNSFTNLSASISF